MSTKNPLKLAEIAASDPNDIEFMPGYVPPKLRKHWTPTEHCKFANDQLAWRGVNRDRAAKGLDPVRWMVKDGAVVLEG